MGYLKKLRQPIFFKIKLCTVKPDGYKFESLGRVRDGSKSSKSKNIYEKGYHVTEACVLGNKQHPISIYSVYEI